MNMIRVLIADDHPVVRQGLKQILAETADIQVLDEASNAQEVLDCIWNKDYDVVLLDISMPGKSGLDILKEIKRSKSNLHVLVLSMHPEEQYAIRVFKAGASGYLNKESATDELISAIRKVSCGRKYISSTVAEKLAFDLETDSQKPPHEKLSDREYQVLCLLAIGKRVIEIGEILHLSVKTVSTYRTRILEKMQMKSNAELTHYAIKHDLVD